jgi:hypothetical protein
VASSLSLSPSPSGVERENEDGWCIFMYFQDTCIFSRYIFSRCNLYKEIYIFRKGNIELCSSLLQRVHTGFCQKKHKNYRIKTIVTFSKNLKTNCLFATKAQKRGFVVRTNTKTRVCCQDKHNNKGLLPRQTQQQGFVVKTNTTTRVCCQGKHKSLANTQTFFFTKGGICLKLGDWGA